MLGAENATLRSSQIDTFIILFAYIRSIFSQTFTHAFNMICAQNKGQIHFTGNLDPEVIQNGYNSLKVYGINASRTFSLRTHNMYLKYVK